MSRFPHMRHCAQTTALSCVCLCVVAFSNRRRGEDREGGWYPRLGPRVRPQRGQRHLVQRHHQRLQDGSQRQGGPQICLRWPRRLLLQGAPAQTRCEWGGCLLSHIWSITSYVFFMNVSKIPKFSQFKYLLFVLNFFILLMHGSFAPLNWCQVTRIEEHIRKLTLCSHQYVTRERIYLLCNWMTRSTSGG